jgi:hypothetical protein
MRMHIRSILDRVEFYAGLLVHHPLLERARANALPREVLVEFAQLQYADSILWIPMLSLMKARAQSPRLVAAIDHNIADEAGRTSASHVELARTFVRSLGVADFATGGLAPDVVEMVSHWSRLPEPALAGWLLAAERLVPIMFGAMRPCYAGLGASLRYLDEHIAVDEAAHARWMEEAVDELLGAGVGSDEVLHGVDIGAREVFNVPDVLYAKTLWCSES